MSASPSASAASEGASASILKESCRALPMEDRVAMLTRDYGGVAISPSRAEELLSSGEPAGKIVNLVVGSDNDLKTFGPFHWTSNTFPQSQEIKTYGPTYTGERVRVSIYQSEDGDLAD